MNHEVKKITKLLHPNGTLKEKGYAKKMHFIYNRENIKCSPIQLKEWNFYQFHCGTYALQFTIGHVSYMGQMAVTLIDLSTGERWGYATMKPFFTPKLDLNPEEPSFCEFKNNEAHLTFKVTDQKRILTFKGSTKTFPATVKTDGEHRSTPGIDIRLTIENDKNNEKMVIATPFQKANQFYLNYKENYYKANGSVRFGNKIVDFANASGLLDWGRGVWPYSHEWYWGSLTSHINGIPFGFNIGWGFGDTSHATENIYFYNKKGYKVGKIVGDWNENNLLAEKHFHDKENKIQFTFRPLFNNYTENKYVVVDTHCNQVYGYFSGTIQTEDGLKEFENALGFIEHAVNRW